MNILELPFVGGHLNYGIGFIYVWFIMASGAQLILKSKKQSSGPCQAWKDVSYLLYFFLNCDLRFMPGIFQMSKAYLLLWDL